MAKALAVVWTVGDLIAFGITVLDVMDKGRSGSWAMPLFVTAAVSATILWCGIAVAVFAPDVFAPIGRVIDAAGSVVLANALGLLGLAIATSIPLFALSSYFYPVATIRVTSESDLPSAVFIDTDSTSCGDFRVVNARETTTVSIPLVNEMSCWGARPRRFRVQNAIGLWTCDWHDAKANEPIILSPSGLNCS